MAVGQVDYGENRVRWKQKKAAQRRLIIWFSAYFSAYFSMAFSVAFSVASVGDAVCGLP